MLHETDTALIARMSGLLNKGTVAETKAALSDFLAVVCQRNAVPTDGLGKSQSALIWRRQIALRLAAETYGSHGAQVDLLNAMIEAERTVWDDRELDRLADDLMCHAELVADEWRGEAEVLRGEI